MSLRRGFASILLSLGLTMAGCQVLSSPSGIEQYKAPKISEKKYAVISTGASLRNEEEGLVDPIDKNCFWVSTVKVYNELLKNGYKPENIFVLYKDGQPPFDDPYLLKEINEIKKEFTDSSINIATKNNLVNLLDSLEPIINPEDKFTLYIDQHGSSLGSAHFEYDNSYIFGHELGEVLKGNKSKEVLIVTGTCYAEMFSILINHPAVIISGSKCDKYGWGDKNFSWGQVFFEEMNNPKNDTNHDKEVSPYEAFLPAKKRSKQYRKTIDEFLKKDYEGTGCSEEELNKIDLIPTYIERKD
jgi:hypothetical protein